ncbi:MAG TPA: hypothetical protein VD887_07855 [Allosphingosinicella sp.]|nr:hypothetical protein [Allosphingosinicella sp.]
MEPQLRELLHVAMIVGAAVLLVGLLVFAAFLGWRQHQLWRHGRISKQRRYEATQIDLFRKRGEDAEAGRSAHRHHHRRRRHHSPSLEINLFRSSQAAEEAPAAGAADPPDPGARRD